MARLRRDDQRLCEVRMAMEEAFDEVGGERGLGAVASDHALGEPVDQLFAHHGAAVPLFRCPSKDLALLFL